MCYENILNYTKHIKRVEQIKHLFSLINQILVGKDFLSPLKIIFPLSGYLHDETTASESPK